MTCSPLGEASASSVSTETPRKLVSNFDHLVTQWMSHGTFSEGSSANSSHVHARTVPTMPSTRKL